MAADLQGSLQLTPGRIICRIPMPKWSPKIGGKREGAGRPKFCIQKGKQKETFA